jgi:hypothetical protein
MRPGSHPDSTDHMEKKRNPIPIPGADRGSSDIRGHYFLIRRLVPRLLAPMRTSILIPTTQQAVDVHVARVAEAARACRGNSKGVGVEVASYAAESLRRFGGSDLTIVVKLTTRASLHDASDRGGRSKSGCAQRDGTIAQGRAWKWQLQAK